MRLVLVMGLSEKVAARYKSKKIIETGAVVYQYSDRQIALRNRQKAERLEKLRSSVNDLRAQYRKDLTSKDPQKRLTALAVALVDETYERVGNDDSAKAGHFGVTGWKKQHIVFVDGGATISYVGKSGVKQKKSVQTKAIVSALRQAYDECKDGSGIFDSGEIKVCADKVNSYLKDFGVTAKDIRGFHANAVMQANLKAVRKGELPSDPKARKKVLQTEFKAALAETAQDLGHEADTLRNQYLVPGLEDDFLKDGSVLSKMIKEALDRRSHCLACDRPPTKVARIGGDILWHCDKHWTSWEATHRAEHEIDLDGGLAPTDVTFRVIERFLTTPKPR